MLRSWHYCFFFFFPGLDGRGYGLELLLNKVLDFNHRNSEAGKRIQVSGGIRSAVGVGEKIVHCLMDACCAVPDPQVLGMSATIPNLSFLAKWMDAWVYETDFRPVELK